MKNKTRKKNKIHFVGIKFAVHGSGCGWLCTVTLEEGRRTDDDDYCRKQKPSNPQSPNNLSHHPHPSFLSKKDQKNICTYISNKRYFFYVLFPAFNAKMASTVIESWKLVTAIDNYEEVAGKILFTRYVQEFTWS